MKTDFEKTKELLEGFGVKIRSFDEAVSPQEAEIVYNASCDDVYALTGPDVKVGKIIKVGGGSVNNVTGTKLVGYGSFYSMYFFDTDGKFLAIGTWE